MKFEKKLYFVLFFKIPFVISEKNGLLLDVYVCLLCFNVITMSDVIHW
jgi:hypothetical protein